MRRVAIQKWYPIERGPQKAAAQRLAGNKAKAPIQLRRGCGQEPVIAKTARGVLERVSRLPPFFFLVPLEKTGHASGPVSTFVFRDAPRGLTTPCTDARFAVSRRCQSSAFFKAFSRIFQAVFLPTKISGDAVFDVVAVCDMRDLVGGPVLRGHDGGHEFSVVWSYRVPAFQSLF